MDVDVGVGIALYSMMITIIVFLGGFALLVIGRLMDEMAITEGWMSVVRLKSGEEGREGSAKKVMWILVNVLIMVAVSLIIMLWFLSSVGEDGWEGIVPWVFVMFVITLANILGVVFQVVRMSGEFIGMNRRVEAMVMWKRG